MKKWLIIGGITGLVALLGVGAFGAMAFAQSPIDGGSFGGFRGGPGGFGPGGFGGPMDAEFMGRGGPHGGPGFGKGTGGEVTAIDGGSLTVQTRNDETVTVNTNDDTKVMLAETRTEGSISDIQVGDKIGVRGQRNDDGTVEAAGIIILPRGDMAGGKVTEVSGSTITVDNPKDDTTTIVTNADTQFRVGRNNEGSLEDVNTDSFVMAVGELQDDGSLMARQVMIGKRGLHGPGGSPPHIGKVSTVDGTSFTVETFWEEETITVLTDENTEYRTRGGEEVSFEDIAVGTKVMVKGQLAEGEENTVQAEVVGIKK